MTATPRRLVTTVEIDVPVVRADTMSVSALLQVELADGRRISLLDDRGWGESTRGDVWRGLTVDDVAETARVVVGPDEPADGQSFEDATIEHWGALAQDLAEQGVVTDPDALAALPHDVDLGPRLRARLGS